MVHPDVAQCCSCTPTPSIEHPLDTARAVTNMWQSGAFERWPRIRFIICHGGGALPMVAQRLNAFGRLRNADGVRIHDALEQFAHLYCDTANASGPALAAARAMVPDSQILFGTDAPVLSIGPQMQARSAGP